MMCPDRELLSAFFDGEVEDPWRTDIKKHLESCLKCRQILSSYQRLRRILEEDPVPDCQGAQLRTLEKVIAGSGVIPGKTVPFWKKRLQVPLPLAAAAAVVLIFLGAFFSLKPGRTSTQLVEAGTKPTPLAELSIEIPVADLQDDNIETIIKLFEDRDYNNEVIIRLPEDSLFPVSGKPQFIRANDLNGRK